MLIQVQKLSQNLLLPMGLPERVLELMFRAIYGLRPSALVGVTIYPALEIFSFHYKDAKLGNYEMIYLGCTIARRRKYIVEAMVNFAV